MGKPPRSNSANLARTRPLRRANLAVPARAAQKTIAGRQEGERGPSRAPGGHLVTRRSFREPKAAGKKRRRLRLPVRALQAARARAFLRIFRER